jgi:hypothetical protein
LVAIDPVVSEENIEIWNVDGRPKSDGNSSHGLKARSAEKGNNSKMQFQLNICLL